MTSNEFSKKFRDVNNYFTVGLDAYYSYLRIPSDLGLHLQEDSVILDALLVCVIMHCKRKIDQLMCEYKELLDDI